MYAYSPATLSTPFAVAPDVFAGGAELDDAEFDLDLRVVEAAFPIAKLLCDTGDGCGSTCSGSACSTSPNGPF
jgi:FxLD family lantipeptide